MGVYLLVHDLAHRQQLFHLRGGFHRVGDCPGNNRTAVSQFKIFLYITSSQGACVKCDYHHPVRSHTVYLRSFGPFRASCFFHPMALCTSAVSHIHLLPYRSGNHVRLTGIKIQEHIVILQHGILYRLWYPDLRGSLYLFQDSTHVAVPLCRGECGHTAVVAPWIIFDTEYPDGHSLQ